MAAPHEYPGLLDHAQDLFLVLAADGEIQYANAATERILGYPPRALVGQDAFAFVHPEDRAATRETFDRLVASDGAVDEVEYRTLAADGSWVWLQSRMEGVTSPDLDGYVVSARDVADRKHAEAEREASRAQLQEIAEQANDVLWMFSADWAELLFVNPAYEEIWGQSVADLREDPTSFLDGVHPDDREQVVAEMARLSAGEEVSVEYRVNPDREFRRWVQVEGVPVFEDGEVARIVGYARDVTDRRRRERQLRVMDRLLRHNLNNDMNVILGHAELAQEATRADLQGHLDTIVRTGESLLATAAKERDIVDVLVEPLARTPVAVAPLVREAVAAARESHPAATVELSCPDDVGVTVPALRLAFDELVENAIAHTPGPAPTVRVVVDCSPTHVDIAVHDDGPPIPTNEYRPLFDDEFRASYHGTGLGLTLACWVVDLADGDIAFERADGGNRVVVTLPRDESAAVLGD
ncbi:PAS domain-containing sensor histidine kinase [Halorarius litoreus]|uniref:PAS domain-containing sensor histidine kinase n=1 Tax=Halorarius litoreus TaxID=2962676 RepID=UPI0020CBF3FA|nr:PAS domain-containing sensor histidine kinase [Halorarius litoreus]